MRGTTGVLSKLLGLSPLVAVGLFPSGAVAISPVLSPASVLSML